MNIFTKIKEIDNFTEIEKIFFDYILSYLHDVLKFNIKNIAKIVCMFLNNIQSPWKARTFWSKRIESSNFITTGKREQEKNDVDMNIIWHLQGFIKNSI